MCTNDFVGSTGFTNLCVPTACANPAVADGMTIAAASNQTFSTPAVTWGAEEGALVYAESTPGSGWAVTLARFDPEGRSIGAPVSLGTSLAGSLGPRVAVATNSAPTYLVCWDGSTSTTAGVTCAWISGDGGVTPDVFSDPGGSPSLAYENGAYGFADVSPTGDLTIDEIDDPGGPEPTAAPVDSRSPGGFPVIASSTYRAVCGYLGSNGDLDVVTNFGNPALEVLIPDAGTSNHDALALALSSNLEVAAVWREGSSSTGSIVAATTDLDGNSNPPVAISGTGVSHGHVAVAGATNSFAATWSDESGSIMYVPLDITGNPSGAAVPVLQVDSDNSPHALVTVNQGFIVAGVTGTGADVIQLAHLACP